MAGPEPPLISRRSVLGHLGISVPDLEAARSYYDRVLALLGFEPYLVAVDQIAYRPVGNKPGTYLFFYPAPDRHGEDRTGSRLQHLAFTVPTRSDVRAAHRLVLDLGATVLHPPRVFPEYPAPYFATFWLDPTGLMLEAVCHHDRD